MAEKLSSVDVDVHTHLPEGSADFSVAVEESMHSKESTKFVVGTISVPSKLRPTLSAGSQDYIHKVTLSLTAPTPLTTDIATGDTPGFPPEVETLHKETVQDANTQTTSSGSPVAATHISIPKYKPDSMKLKISSPEDTSGSKGTSNGESHSSNRSGAATGTSGDVCTSPVAKEEQCFSGKAPSEANEPFPLQKKTEPSNVQESVPPRQGYDHPPRQTTALLSSHQQEQSSLIAQVIQPRIVPPSTQASISSQPSASSSPLPPPLQFSENDPDYLAVKSAAECLHAQDYSKMAGALQNAPDTIPVIFGRGLAYYKLAKYSLATTSFEQMLERSRHDPNLRGNVYLAHYYIGEIDLGHGRYETASNHFEQSAAAFCHHTLAKRYRIVPPSQAILFSKRGSALNHSHKVLAAVESYKKAISLAETNKDKLAAHTSLGNLYQSVGDNQSALLQYEDTIRLAEELGDYIYLGWAHGNMGNAYLGLYQKDKALFHLEKSLELTVQHEPSPQAIGRAYNNLGTAHQSLGDVNKAEDYYDLALSQAIYGRDMGGQARAYGNIGNLLMIQKKYEAAIIHYTEAMSIGKDRSTKSTAYHNRGCANYEKAEADKKQFFKRLEGQSSAMPPPGGGYVVTYKGPNVHRLPQPPSHLPPSIRENYEQGRNDLMRVVENHEETIQTIKGSTRGLTLSVSLSETNSRTFHRLQDCLFNLDQLDTALEYAEQSRARSLGELLLERKGRQLEMSLTSPLTMEQINNIIDRVNTTVVYISYTGSRLLVWVFTPINGYTCQNMFQVTLSDDQFEGKSLDYYLRYSLSELLIENNMEMYSISSYDEPSPLTVLYDLFGRPLLNVLQSVYSQTNTPESEDAMRDVILVPDSYTNLMPIVALLNIATEKFLGDKYRFRYMPSLLTMGILCQLPEVVVEVREESRSFCIVGNPTIPPFKYQGDTWNLGKLPHATKEAEWVAHILKCNPTLHEQATKMVVTSMMSTAKIVHLATHGSATSGFLAFAGRGSSRSKQVSEEKLVLLYPEEVEKLSISPALVVLSSCDSGRGVVKADGIQGMARAFILAGAQSVLTSLWRVPDESASTFMQFLYQYMMDGFQSSRALQKAILSVRSFSKYSRYIHWSGYQLTGREVKLKVKRSLVDLEVRRRVGSCAVFPRLNILKKLETMFVKDPRVPTDVQLLHGFHGLKPSETVIEFIIKYHTHFSGGVFWVNGTCPEFVSGAELEISKAMSGVPSPSLLRPTLVVLDSLTSLPQPGHLLSLLKNNNTHIIVIFSDFSIPDDFRKEIDRKLIRGLNVVPLKPLSRIHSTQRIVHSVLCEHEFTPHSREQAILADIADKVGGSSSIVDITSALLGRCIEECVHREDTSEAEEKSRFDFLSLFSENVLKESVIDPTQRQPTDSTDLQSTATSNAGKQDKDLSITRYTSRLLDGFHLTRSEYLLLSSLAMFGPVPIPKSLIDTAQSLIMTAKPTSETLGTLMPISNLISAKLLLVYPSSVIVTPPHSLKETTPFARRSSDASQFEEDADYFYVPQLVKDALWEKMKDLDREFAITAAYKSLEQLGKKVERRVGEDSKDSIVHYCGGLAHVLVNLLESKGQEVKNETLLNLSCYQEIVKLYYNLRIEYD